MMRNFFDVIILGESLASRIAGLMLARQGCRILTFQGGNASASGWFQSCLHLERLLENLGGRSCFSPPAPFQVLTEKSRLEINGSIPLEEELRRELADGHGPVAALLRNLQQAGEKLEAAVWRAGSLPLGGAGTRLRFTLRRLGAGRGLGSLKRPLADLLRSLKDAEGREILSALFAGMTLTPPDRLSVGEAALRWSAATRSKGVSPSGLDALVRHRYEQFHGQTEELATLKSLAVEKDHLTGGSLQGGGGCGASFFLFGSPEAVRLHLPQLKMESGRDRRRFITSPIDGLVSPLLARRVILAGEPPLRLVFGTLEGHTRCAVDYHPVPGRPPMKEDELRQRLASALPFGRFELEKTGSEDAALGAGRPDRPRLLGPARSPRLFKNAFLCHGESVLPALGSVGEVLLGASLARALLRRLKKG